MTTIPLQALVDELTALHQRVRDLLERYREPLGTLPQLRAEITSLEQQIAQDRKRLAQPPDDQGQPNPSDLRGSVLYENDIVSPTGEIWEAEA